MQTRKVATVAALVVTSALIVAVAACRSIGSGSPAASTTPAFLDVQIPPRPAASDSTVARGREVYAANCVQCHGDSGKGDGYGAPFLVPAPRDLTAAEYKFRTTKSGSIPTDEDLFRIISRGAGGTGMPPWQYLLSDADRWALVDYVKTLSPKFERFKPAIATIPATDNAGDAERGRAIYTKMQCAKCHGDDGRGVGPSAYTLVDSQGRHVPTRDFTNPGTFRTGWTAREIVRTFETGNNGVPMPSFSGAMKPQEEYDLAAYVMSFAGKGGDQKRTTARSMKDVGEPARVIKLREHAWKFDPAEIRIKAGEVVRIDYSVTDNGLGAGHGFAIDGFDQEVFVNGATVGSPQSVTFKIDQPGRYGIYCSTQCSTTQLHPHMKGLLIVE